MDEYKDCSLNIRKHTLKDIAYNIQIKATEVSRHKSDKGWARRKYFKCYLRNLEILIHRLSADYKMIYYLKIYQLFLFKLIYELNII